MKIRHWNHHQIRDFEKIIDNFPNGGKVLDLGAWDGATKELFGKEWEWVGIDVNPIGEGVVLGDAHNLEYPENYFDLVISIAVFEHLHSPWTAIKEVSRVLKKGGLFFGTTAFLEPEHDNSYFHMSQNGLRKIIDEGSLIEIYVKPTENWTVINSMKILPFFGRLLPSLKSSMILGLRRFLIRLRIFIASGEKKGRAIKYFEKDRQRYSGSFRFLCKKK